MASSMELRCVVLIVCLLPSLSFCYFITVEAHEEQCFFDKVTSGTKMGLLFEVAYGGEMDIDVTVSL